MTFVHRVRSRQLSYKVCVSFSTELHIVRGKVSTIPALFCQTQYFHSSSFKLSVSLDRYGTSKIGSYVVLSRPGNIEEIFYKTKRSYNDYKT